MSADTLLRDLISDCEDPTSYPTKLRHTQLLPHSLQRHHEHLKEREVDVFEDDPEYWRIRFLDCYDGEEQFPLALKDCFAVQDLREYLLDGLNKLDPKCRHVFLEATHAQAPLDCSREMLVLLFTFHQVMPQFLDILLSFGRRPGRNVPVAFHHCIFRFEHFMDLSPRRFEIPQLGRSGLEIRHCYNLWAAEKSLPERGHKNKHPWAVRQAGLYHSFDVKTGRATWIHIKANDMIQKRIKQATDQAERFQPKSLETVEGSFAATLLTHLVMIEWCGESWAQYLSYWECQIEEILTRVKSAQIADVEKDILGDFSYIPPIANRSVSFQTPSRRGTGVVSSRSVRTPSRKNTVMTTNSATITNLPTRLLARVKSGLVGSAALAQSNSPELPVSRPGFETNNVQANEDAALKIFDEFKFLDLQRLHGFGDRLQEADMILGLNLDIVSEIIEYYKSYVQDPETPEFIRKGCRSDLSHFVQRASGIVRELRTEKTRITTLLALLEDGKAIFEAITQLRNIELNRRASKRMEEMTEDMHQLTLQTKRDTSSMHLITGVTLVFLPGTFVAVRYALPALWNLFFSSSCLTTSNDQTFLGAGFYQWPEAPDGSGADGIAKFPVFRPRYFSLFLAISLVLTVITLLIWWGRIWLAPRATNWWRDVRGLQKEKDEEALDSAPKVEKSP